MSTTTGKMSSEASEIAWSCPICMETYSTIRYPIVSPECGHSLCIDCGKERNSNVCFTCESQSFVWTYWVQNLGVSTYTKGPLRSSSWKKNFALLSLVEQHDQEKGQMREQMEAEKRRMTVELEELKKKFSNDIDFMDCANCKSKEKRERMKICVTCAEKSNKNKKWKGMKEEEILPFILCAFCCHEKDEHRGHALANYLPWKLNGVLSATVITHQCTVSGMDELNHYEMERGKECVEIWKKEMDSCGSIDSMKCETYREGLSIVDVLNKECELVTRASEDCLPPLRKYSKIVKESTARIQQLKTDAIEEGIEEDV